MGLFSRIFGRTDNAKRDAETLYNGLMVQARRPEFYGEGRFPDNYDGRIDVLTLHIAPIYEALRTHGENGQRLSQALFDYMKDDFEIALREEGLSDTGVAKRIKPMIRLFYTRVKDYTDAFEGGRLSDVAERLYAENEDERAISLEDEFKSSLEVYITDLRQTLSDLNLGEIARARFQFPIFGVDK